MKSLNSLKTIITVSAFSVRACARAVMWAVRWRNTSTVERMV